ncbi:uncharacterized protein CLUP02_15195 [Colletotrichum lupini]|uniref:Uncharacterized protein n=1 Tax=Colletotrichum lupini TaxID=145971 RepID=A0A9Q8WNB2_9PEZI|nr:uncharacterized protein CLUP02_15195 [Colletotrichum lupini]UQC89664.1 hypothetical protein CLUP02_15195 [Colletotrichum lupini]
MEREKGEGSFEDVSNAHEVHITKTDHHGQEAQFLDLENGQQLKVRIATAA